MKEKIRTMLAYSARLNKGFAKNNADLSSGNVKILHDVPSFYVE